MEESMNPPPLKSSNALNSTSSTRSGEKGLMDMERSRREKMAEFYSVLQSLVPNLFPKATRARIIDQTIDYIRSLQDVITALESNKSTKVITTDHSVPFMPLHTETRSSVDIAFTGNAAFFGVRSPSTKPGMVTKVVQVFDKHRAQVLAVAVACNGGDTVITVTATVMEDDLAERIKTDLMIITSLN